MIIPHSLYGSLPFLLTNDEPYRVTHLLPYAVVSLSLSMSVLTAPVTHQGQGLQKNGFSSATPSALSGPENLRFHAVSKSWVTDLMVVSQPLVAHGVGGQDIGDLLELGLERLTNQVSWFFTNPTPGSPFQPKSLPK